MLLVEHARVVPIEHLRRDDLRHRDHLEPLAPLQALDHERSQLVGAIAEAADCVLANILAGPLIELAQILTSACKPGGDLVLSGILSAQESAVMACYASRFDSICSRQRDEWCCIHARGAC